MEQKENTSLAQYQKTNESITNEIYETMGHSTSDDDKQDSLNSSQDEGNDHLNSSQDDSQTDSPAKDLLQQQGSRFGKDSKKVVLVSLKDMTLRSLGKRGMGKTIRLEEMPGEDGYSNAGVGKRLSSPRRKRAKGTTNDTTDERINTSDDNFKVGTLVSRNIPGKNARSKIIEKKIIPETPEDEEMHEALPMGKIEKSKPIESKNPSWEINEGNSILRVSGRRFSKQEDRHIPPLHQKDNVVIPSVICETGERRKLDIKVTMPNVTVDADIPSSIVEKKSKQHYKMKKMKRKDFPPVEYIENPSVDLISVFQSLGISDNEKFDIQSARQRYAQIAQKRMLEKSSPGNEHEEEDTRPENPSFMQVSKPIPQPEIKSPRDIFDLRKKLENQVAKDQHKKLLQSYQDQMKKEELYRRKLVAFRKSRRNSDVTKQYYVPAQTSVIDPTEPNNQDDFSNNDDPEDDGEDVPDDNAQQRQLFSGLSSATFSAYPSIERLDPQVYKDEKEEYHLLKQIQDLQETERKNKKAYSVRLAKIKAKEKKAMQDKSKQLEHRQVRREKKHRKMFLETLKNRKAEETERKKQQIQKLKERLRQQQLSRQHTVSFCCHNNMIEKQLRSRQLKMVQESKEKELKQRVRSRRIHRDKKKQHLQNLWFRDLNRKRALVAFSQYQKEKLIKATKEKLTEDVTSRAQRVKNWERSKRFTVSKRRTLSSAGSVYRQRSDYNIDNFAYPQKPQTAPSNMKATNSFFALREQVEQLAENNLDEISIENVPLYTMQEDSVKR